MIQLELLNRPRPSQLTPERLGLLGDGINRSKPLFEALADNRGLRFGGVTAPPMNWERLLAPELPKSAMNWERLLTLPEALPKPVISIALPDRPKPLIAEFDLSKSYPAHFLMNRILDSAADRISYREQAQRRAMETVPMPYFEPPEIQQLTAARQALQQAIAVPTAQPLPEVRPQPTGVLQKIKGVLPSMDSVNSVAVFLAANQIAQVVSSNLEGRLPINPILTYFGVHLLALAYLGADTFIDSYKAQEYKDAQLALADTVRALPRKITKYAVAGGTWNTLSVLTQR